MNLGVVIVGCCVVSFLVGWWMGAESDKAWEPSQAQLKAQTATCYREFDAYVRDQTRWLKQINEELRDTAELQKRNHGQETEQDAIALR